MEEMMEEMMDAGFGDVEEEADAEVDAILMQALEGKLVAGGSAPTRPVHSKATISESQADAEADALVARLMSL
ncbi:hypothetical protein KIPB_012357 [Kipferlia bialata]|uniref:Uncharacterized protein n=1 Tax=Kipferlia bialata TaxID=797122 RepID=A0A391P7H7_9EUKA|nr:hypothetical protein KIPB_012357 [Kipferlia bialata]|eukprot:g12357.t1